MTDENRINDEELEEVVGSGGELSGAVELNPQPAPDLDSGLTPRRKKQNELDPE